MTKKGARHAGSFFAFAPNPVGKPTLLESQPWWKADLGGSRLLWEPTLSAIPRQRASFTHGSASPSRWGCGAEPSAATLVAPVAPSLGKGSRCAAVSDGWRPVAPVAPGGVFDSPSVAQRKRPAVQAGPLTGLFARRSSVPQVAPRVAADGSSRHGGSCGPSNARNLGASRSVGIPLMRVGSGLARDSPPSVERVRRCIASERAVTSLARSPRGLLRHRRD